MNKKDMYEMKLYKESLKRNNLGEMRKRKHGRSWNQYQLIWEVLKQSFTLLILFWNATVKYIPL